MNVFNNNVKFEIEQAIESEFKEALIGIKMLPGSSKFGVYLAYKYYLSLFHKIRNKNAQSILNQRIRIPNGVKFVVMLKSYVRYKTEIL